MENKIINKLTINPLPKKNRTAICTDDKLLINNIIMAQFLFMFFVFGHNVHNKMNFLFAFVWTIRTFELRLFVTLPSTVII